jgi:hypothetical protein
MNRNGRRPDGQARRSQVLTTAGAGALVDLVEDAVIIKGLDGWHYPSEDEGFIEEPRLARAVLGQLRSFGRWRRAHVRLRLPPVADPESPGPHRGIHAREFPKWFLCARCQSLVQRSALDARRRHQCSPGSTAKPAPTVPVRFVAACARGHIQDINWRYFLHPGEPPAGVEEPFRCLPAPERAAADLAADGERPTADLQLRTEGTTGELADLLISCRRCGARRSLQDLNRPHQLGRCFGWRPWLSTDDNEECPEPTKLLVRTATNAWLPLSLSALHLGEGDRDLRRVVDSHWEALARLDCEADVAFARRKVLPLSVAKELEPYTDAEILARVLQKAAGVDEDDKVSLRAPEWAALTAAEYGLSTDLPERGVDWFATRVSPPELPPAIDRVVLVPALKIVFAQVGFLRLEGFPTDAEGLSQPDPARVAPLSLHQDWVPAVEQRGEGFFISFDEAHLRAWEERPAVRTRAERFRRAMQAHNRAAGRPDESFEGPRLLMLHSLAHMLIRAISLECGYSAAAIRERIYCYRAPDLAPGQPDLAGSRAGIMLYTGTPGSEGTLGGLVEVGRNIAHHLAAALEANRLCSNDPVCAQHGPDTLDGRHREGAACHGCLLIAEPSCERMNADLDRAFVVETVDEGSAGCAFFGG